MDRHTLRQIQSLKLHPHRPLFICDVDEVIVRFIDSLQDWLQTRELHLHCDSWALEGNIRTRTGEALPSGQVHALLHAFFAECTAEMPLMESAADSLSTLAREGVQVVMLSNIPHLFRQQRRRNLMRHGLDFPLITNSGPKGPAIRHLRRMVHQPAAFMDDHPDFLHSAAQYCPAAGELHLLHYVPDNPFVPHLPPMNAPHIKVRNWREAAQTLHRLLVLPAMKQHVKEQG